MLSRSPLPAALAVALFAAPSSVPAQEVPPADALIGRWGMSAYFRTEDIPRAIAQARAACANPFVIEPGEEGGVRMFTIDLQGQRQTRFGTRRGEVVLGVVDEPDERYDRTVTFDGPDRFTWTWRDQSIANRLGINLFVRCR